MCQFEQEVKERVSSNEKDDRLYKSAEIFMERSIKSKYSYNFSWLGRPIIQYPQDIVAMQEIIWEVKPNLIIETGIAHGGSLIFSASMLALLEIAGLIKEGRVLGIDIDIREHNKVEIEKHPFSNKIEMIQGSSVDPSIVKQVHDFAKSYTRILVVLDSNHTHEHVLNELKSYASLTSLGSYCVVFDTIIEDMPEDMFPDRPWGIGNNPKTAVWEYLQTHPEFEINKSIQNKLQVTVAPDGFLKRIL